MRHRTVFTRLILTLVAAMGLHHAAGAQTVINFDVDAVGNTINAPNFFSQTTRLTTLYSALGVTFSGPGGNDGGAILNQGSSFGVNALSTPNFLGFNHGAIMNDGGTPQGPETITFSSAQTFVSIFASGGDNSGRFQMEAFDAGNNLIGSDIQSNAIGAYAQLTVTAPGITSVVLTQLVGDNTYVYDDLSFSGAAIPEPGTVALLSLAAGTTLGIGLWRRRRVSRR